MKLNENGRKRLDAMKKALAAGLPLAGLLAATAAFAADPPESPTAGSIPPPPPDVWRTAGEPAPPPTAPDENAVPAPPPWDDGVAGLIEADPEEADGESGETWMDESSVSELEIASDCVWGLQIRSSRDAGAEVAGREDWPDAVIRLEDKEAAGDGPEP